MQKLSQWWYLRRWCLLKVSFLTIFIYREYFKVKLGLVNHWVIVSKTTKMATMLSYFNHCQCFIPSVRCCWRLIVNAWLCYFYLVRDYGQECSHSYDDIAYTGTLNTTCDNRPCVVNISETYNFIISILWRIYVLYCIPKYHSSIVAVKMHSEVIEA